ncbi:MAG: DUF6273 domain-containing protein, partial [Clostridiales bacterium]|nr:DUF6273 domain-containing protein [Clostridiales bacterium]
SDRQAAQCEERISKIIKTQEAEERAAKRKKIIAITVSLVAVVAIIVTVLAETVIIPQSKINKATQAVYQGEYNNINVGDRFNFGAYNNGEDITWRVLAKEENKILVISDKALFDMSYNEEYTGITWEKCTLRKYLNNDFLNNCFSEENQKRILKTKVINDNNPEYETSGGADTVDKVFLLSIDEANKYFTSDNDRKARDIRGQKSWWWLRSPGNHSYNAAYVYYVGSVSDRGAYVNCNGNYGDHVDGAVRPALWINLES